MANTAVGSEYISRVVGYQLKGGKYLNQTPNLPQRIAVIGQGTVGKQSTMPTTATEITSLKQAGDLFGYGSAIYSAIRILKPVNSDGVGGIPVVVYPQLDAGSSVAKTLTFTVTGTATASATHYVVVNGRTYLDGKFYQVNIVLGDTPTIIASKIADAINAVQGCPLSAAATTGTIVFTSKTAGLVYNDNNISFSFDVAAGITYAQTATTAGVGTPDITNSLQSFGDVWNTLVLNTYGLVPSVITALEAYNGKPDENTPTGRYSSMIMKPFVALTGSIANDEATFSEAKKNECTIAVCIAPLSKGLSLEAAANYCAIYARIAQDTPHLDIAGRKLIDMPTPSTIGDMEVYTNRQVIVKKGCSTVSLTDGSYVIQDFVTTWHPDNEIIPQFRYVRNLTVDYNVYFGYYLKEVENVVDHVIANDEDIVEASKVIKPKQWKAIISEYSDELVKRGLTTNSDFMKASIRSGISTVNPDRLDTEFSYKRSSIARISSTEATAYFN